MGAFFDIALSILVGSLLLLMIVSYNNDMIETNGINGMYSIVQQAGMDFQDIFKNDLRKIGMGVPEGTAVFLDADSNLLRFNADLDLDGSLNQIIYYIGNTTTANFTENPNDRMLFRRVDAGAIENYTYGIVDFSLIYYDEDGIQTTTLNDIRQVEYRCYMESTFGYGGEYPGIYVRGRIKPKNLD